MIASEARIHPTADVDVTADVGAFTAVWDYAQVREHARIGSMCVIGRGAYVDRAVRMGDSCKIQNYALVYDPAVLEDCVFIGPGAILTNDQRPRAAGPDGRALSAGEWTKVGVVVRSGASVGAHATCVAPVTVGRWAMVGAGATVVHDVPDFALVVGVPARRIGWVGRAGQRLTPLGGGRFVCPRTGATYHEVDGLLAEDDMDQA